MTLDQLLDCNAAKLESFTDEQLRQWFAPYFDVTRPEKARALKSKTQQRELVTPFMTPGKKRAIEALKQIEGFDVTLFTKRKIRKT